MLTTQQRDRMARVDGPIHLWFGLSYASYAVQPRSILQSMPVEWQERFVALMEEGEEVGYEFPERDAHYNVMLCDNVTGRFVSDKQRHYRRVFVEPKEGFSL